MKTLNEMKRMLVSGELDAKLSQMYCRDGNNLLPYRERLCRVIDGYNKIFGKYGYSEIFGKAENTPAALFSAPGRTELIGGRTDHRHGKVLTSSVDLDAVACAVPNGMNTINIYLLGHGMISISLTDKQPNPAEYNTLQALIRGVACETEKLDYNVAGFDAYVISDVPSGSGLAPSACFEVLIGIIINEFFCGGELSAIDIAKIGQKAENIYFGKPSGLLDQMGCSIGGTVIVDFDNGPKCSTVDFSFSQAGYAMVTIDSGADHSDLTKEHAAITNELKSVCEVFGKQTLREIGEQEFYARFAEIREKVGDMTALRAMHIYEENHRIDAQLQALINRDINTFLDLVKRSGVSSWALLQNATTSGQATKLPVAVTFAVTEKALGGRGACRIHGDGFDGSIQAFVQTDFLTTFIQNVESILGKGVCHVTYIRPVGGMVIIG